MNTFDNILVFIFYMLLLVGPLGLTAGFVAFVTANSNRYKWCHRLANWVDKL